MPPMKRKLVKTTVSPFVHGSTEKEKEHNVKEEDVWTITTFNDEKDSSDSESDEDNPQIHEEEEEDDDDDEEEYSESDLSEEDISDTDEDEESADDTFQGSNETDSSEDDIEPVLNSDVNGIGESSGSGGNREHLEVSNREDKHRKDSKNKKSNGTEKLITKTKLNIRDKSNSNLKKDKSSKENKLKSKKRVTETEVKMTENLKEDEYKSDSSDEEDIRNTVGNIPMNWYDDYPHLGYDWDGKRILKPAKSDQLDEFLRRMEDPDFWRTVKDSQTGQNVVLSDADVELIERMQSGKIPDSEFDEYAPWVEWFSSQVMKTPIRKFPEHKRSFLPSISEKKKVSKLVHALKMGWIKPESEKKRDTEPKFYMLWKSDGEAEDMRRIHKHIPAPKRLLPGHAESYNPPPEYLFDKKELKEWNKLATTPWKRKLHFLPQKYNSLREVPSYSRYIIERFNRCLDLYLCPRAIKMKLTIQPEDLVPQLPSPKDLQPFPTTLALTYNGHTDMVRTVTVDPKGQYIVSGSDDMTVKVWEVSTARCLKTIQVGGIVRSVSWCPNQALSLVLVAADRKVLLINPGVGDSLIISKTDAILEEPTEIDALVPDRVKTAVQWEQPEVSSEEWIEGIRVIVNHFKEVRQICWHGRGDYFGSVMPEGQNRSVMIHQLSKKRSQIPFSKSKGQVQCILFHPVRPFLFVATQRNVRIYDLVKQELVKKLLSNSQWISSMAIHPGGDNILVGTYDSKILWFDLDLSTQPYQTLRLHGTAVRGVAFHKRYPIFASASDDRSVIVSHGMVYNDLLKNALIVPLKKLSHHESYQDFGIFDVVFHPNQPWLFSCGADSTIRLYS